MDPTTECLDALADRIAESAALIDSATHQLLTDLRSFDARGGWHRQGALSCAQWLNWRCGIALGAAREKVRVAKALGDLPLVDEALRLGTVSYSKVRALTRVATHDNEAVLLEQARCATASQLERICRFVRGLQPPRASADERDSRRWVRLRQTDEGMVRFEAQLTVDEAELLMKACEPSVETPRRADALVALAERALRGDAPARPPVEVILHVDAQTLAGSNGPHVSAETSPLCDAATPARTSIDVTSQGDAQTLPGMTEGGLPVSAETSRRLLCDAALVPLYEDAAGTPLESGRKRRTISSSLRRALHARDRGCRFPGCTNVLVDGHHLVHWSRGGQTTLSNLALLCRRHHTLMHEGGFSVERTAEGELVFRDPSGRVVPAVPAPPQLRGDGVAILTESARSSGLRIGPETALLPFSIDAPDYDLAVSAVLEARAA